MKTHTLMLLCIAALSLNQLCNTASAQNNDLDRHTWVGGDGNWSADENWSDLQGPDAGAPDEDRWANIGGGIVTVDGNLKTGAVAIGRATLTIGQGRSLTVAPSDFTDGVFDNGNGTLKLNGNGQFSGTDLVGNGTIHLEGPTAQFSLTGDLDFAGELRVGVTATGGAALDVKGTAKLTGTLAPEIDFQPQLGDSFNFITGADSIDVSAAQLTLPNSVSLGRGIGAIVEASASTAAITIRNLPILSIDRTTGATSIMNVVGDTLELTGYSLFSDNGLLQTDGWSSLATQSVAGWEEANARDEAIGELNVAATSPLIAGAAALTIGSPYKSGNIHPTDEDVAFLASFADGSVVNGLVEYTGAPNDLTLRVDPATGEAEISHQSSFVDPVDVAAYSILSGSGSLTPSTWAGVNATDNGWVPANPKSTAIAEFSAAGSSTFSTGVELGLGKIFTPGAAQDLVFEFATPDGISVLTGTVVYEALDLVSGGGCMALNSLGGDFDGNGKVEFADFLVLSNSFGQDVSRYEDGDIDCNGRVEFADFLVLSSNFGSSLGAEASAASVPEPSCTLLVGMGLVGLTFTRRRRK